MQIDILRAFFYTNPHSYQIIASPSSLNLSSFRNNFLGSSAFWYKNVIIAFLIINPILWYAGFHFLTGWDPLAMTLKCYLLQPGGLLAIQATIISMASPESIYHEVENNLKVILLLVFMVAGIHFMRELLLFTFTKILVKIRNNVALSFLFCFSGAFLSAFLDALTVTAILIRLSYMQMVIIALPYTIVLGGVGAAAIIVAF